MNRNIKWLIITIALSVAITVVLFQAAASIMQSQPRETRYDYVGDDMSQTIGPIGPEADPYLEHYRGIVGNDTTTPTVDTYQQGGNITDKS